VSRVIKFRVWDKYRSRWYTSPKELLWGQSGYRELYGDSNAYLGSMYRIDQEIFSSDNSTYDKYDRDRFLLEQFIGLQDKNGKDIYEGDIVRVQGWAMPCVVTYHFGGFVCSYSWIVKDKDKEERVETANISMAYFAGAYLGHIEVVSNIHENPEMIK